MKSLETIEIRLTENKIENIMYDVTLIISEIKKLNKDIPAKIYFHVNIVTDIMIQLEHVNKKVDQRGSQLGLKITSVIKSYGMVNHNVWIDSK